MVAGSPAAVSVPASVVSTVSYPNARSARATAATRSGTNGNGGRSGSAAPPNVGTPAHNARRSRPAGRFTAAGRA
jgi:hypothetical protein